MVSRFAGPEQRAGPTKGQRERLKELEGENRELKRANEIPIYTPDTMALALEGEP